LGVNNILGIRPIAKFGTAEAKKEFLPQLAEGQMLGGIALTEPSAGSNPIEIKTTCVRMPDEKWKLNGEKKWIGSSGWAGVINVFGKADDGVFMGFCAKTDETGMVQGREELTMGLRATMQNTLYMKDLTLSEKYLLGTAGAARIISDTFGYCRTHVLAVCLGAMKRCYVTAHRYSSRRNVNTGNLLKNGVTKLTLQKFMFRIQSLDALISLASRELDKSDSVIEEYSLLGKIFGAEWLGSTVDETMQLLGGRSYIESNDLARFFRDAKIFRIFEGPTETLVFYFGKKVLSTKAMVLNKILGEDLKQTESLKDIANVMAEIDEFVQKKSPPEEGMHILTSKFGEFSGLVLLLAIFKSVNQTPTQVQKSIIDWLNLEVEIARKKVRDEMAKGSLSLDDSSINSFAKLCSGYGPLESYHPGVLYELDEFLREKFN
jgi:alkylation response protein AidB-like acyl-CoA dehydrogenase